MYRSFSAASGHPGRLPTTGPCGAAGTPDAPGKRSAGSRIGSLPFVDNSHNKYMVFHLSPRQKQKTPPRRGFPDDNAGSVLAIAAQLEGLASDAGILELAQQAIEAFFRQLDQAEGLADLDATDGLPGQAALVEDGAQQVAR